VADAARALRDRLADVGAAPAIPPATTADLGALIGAAESWLAAADERHARRAALQAELAALGDDLAAVAAEWDALGEPPDVSGARAELDAARAALAAAQAAEREAQQAAVAAEARLAEWRATEQRVTALQADLAGAAAAEHQAAARVAELEAALAAVLAGAHQRQAAVDVSGVERTPLEVYLLAKVAGQRDVGRAGAVPIVVLDALAGVRPDATQAALGLLERFSSLVQVIYVSDDPTVEEWARLAGGSVRRFSPVVSPS
jgi:hypothetical protein